MFMIDDQGRRWTPPITTEQLDVVNNVTPITSDQAAPARNGTPIPDVNVRLAETVSVKKYKSFADLVEEDFIEVSELVNLPVEEVKRVYDEMVDTPLLLTSNPPEPIIGVENE